MRGIGNGKHPVRFRYPAGPSTTTGLRPSRARRCSSPTEPRSRGRGSYVALWLFPLPLEIEAMELGGLEPPTLLARSGTRWDSWGYEAKLRPCGQAFSVGRAGETGPEYVRTPARAAVAAIRPRAAPARRNGSTATATGSRARCSIASTSCSHSRARVPLSSRRPPAKTPRRYAHVLSPHGADLPPRRSPCPAMG